MESPYNTNHGKEEITSILETIHECIRCGRYAISMNERRTENIMFRDTYRMTPQKQKKLILSIVVEDFCYSLHNTNPGYEHEVLYVFCPTTIQSGVDDIPTRLEVYMKFNILCVEHQFVVVISFHERKKPVRFPFR